MKLANKLLQINKSRQFWLLVLTFLFVFCIFYTLRSSFDWYLRDDYDNIVAFLPNPPFGLQNPFRPEVPNSPFGLQNPIKWGDKGFFEIGADLAFRKEIGRNLSVFIRWVVGGYLSSANPVPQIWFGVVAGLIGMTAVTSFLVARRFLRSDAAALLAAIVFIFSAPSVQASWIVFAGIQTLIPLFISVNLLLYWRVRNEQGKYNYPIAVVLFISLIVSPYFREFIGLAHLLIIYQEAIKYRRPTLVIGMALLALLNTIYPSAIIHFTFFPDVPIRSIFNNGALGGMVGQSKILNPFPYLGSAYLSLLPLANAAVLLALVIDIAKRVRKYHNLNKKEQKILIAYIACTLANSILFVILYNKFYYDIESYPVLILSVYLFIYAAFNQHFVAIWFICSYLPFLYVFTMQTHLLYVLQAGAIIYAMALEQLYFAIADCDIRRRFTGKLLQGSFILLAIILLLDSACNVYGSYQVVHGIEQGIRSTGNFIKERVPKGSIIAYNARHGMEIYTASAGQFVPYPVYYYGATLENLQRLINENFGRKEIYFLDMDRQYCPPGKYGGHGHQWVDYRWSQTEKIANIHNTFVVYPYADPLKYFVSCINVPFLGAPDALNDFDRGVYGLFQHQVNVEYKLYRIISPTISPWMPSGSWQWIEKDYKGFWIWENNNRFFGYIPRSKTFLNLEALSEYFEPTFVSDRLQEVKQSIDAYRIVHPRVKSLQ